MAEYKVNVFLGFEDEIVLDKHSTAVNYTTNKIGGKPVSIHVYITINIE